MLRTCSFSCNSQWQPAQTNIRVRLRLSGTSLYPSCLLANKSKASLMRFAFISARDEHHPRRLSNFAKTYDIGETNASLLETQNFATFSQPSPAPPHHSLYALSPAPSSSAPAIHTPKPKGHSPWQKKRPSSTFGLNLLY